MEILELQKLHSTATMAKKSIKREIASEVMHGVGMRRKGYSHAQAVQFQETFGEPLQKFWDGIFSFDVIRFDHEVAKSRDNESCRDAVAAKWGASAVALVVALNAV